MLVARKPKNESEMINCKWVSKRRARGLHRHVAKHRHCCTCHVPAVQHQSNTRTCSHECVSLNVQMGAGKFSTYGQELLKIIIRTCPVCKQWSRMHCSYLSITCCLGLRVSLWCSSCIYEVVMHRRFDHSTAPLFVCIRTHVRRAPMCSSQRCVFIHPIYPDSCASLQSTPAVQILLSPFSSLCQHPKQSMTHTGRLKTKRSWHSGCLRARLLKRLHASWAVPSSLLR